jgi:hypothetical protein
MRMLSSSAHGISHNPIRFPTKSPGRSETVNHIAPSIEGYVSAAPESFI